MSATGGKQARWLGANSKGMRECETGIFDRRDVRMVLDFGHKQTDVLVYLSKKLQSPTCTVTSELDQKIVYSV